MVRQIVVLVMLVSLLVGCKTQAEPERAVKSVDIELSRCFGQCPHWRATVAKDGKGTFHGILDTATIGFRDFSLEPKKLNAFVNTLEDIRPITGAASRDSSNCVTDAQSADVFWTMETGSQQHLHLYLGCADVGTRRTRATLDRAIAILPIANLIGAN